MRYLEQPSEPNGSSAVVISAPQIISLWKQRSSQRIFTNIPLSMIDPMDFTNIPLSVRIDDLAKNFNVSSLRLLALNTKFDHDWDGMIRAVSLFWFDEASVSSRFDIKCFWSISYGKADKTRMTIYLRPELWRLVPGVIAEADLFQSTVYRCS